MIADSRSIILLLCVILLFGFNAAHLLTPDLIPGDAVGFEIPFTKKIALLGIVSAAVYCLGRPVVCILAIILCLIAGLHISFGQVGPLTGYLSGVLPLGIEIRICHRDTDNALAFLEQSSPDANTLARFHRTVLCHGKSGTALVHACALVQNGTVMRHHALPDRGIMIRSTECRNEARHSTASIICARHSGGHSSVWPVAVMWTTPPRRYGKEEQTLDRTIIRP